MKELSPTAQAIRHYKLNASGGYEEWSKVSCAENYQMHVPSMGFNTSGPIEIQEVIFGWLADIEAKQELVDIVEFGSTVTCYLHISDKDGTILDIVEIFKIDDAGRVEEIWAL
jgi:hypothetical protein